MYKKYISPLLGENCRYYPSCSEFAKEQLLLSDRKTVAFLSSVFRILRCNQLFRGGIDYPLVYKKRLKSSFGMREIEYWLVPSRKKGYYFVVKNFAFKEYREKTK